MVAYSDRLEWYRVLEERLEAKIVCYVTGDRPGLETQISAEVLDFIVDHLDLLSMPNRISLFLYTRGGNTLAGWSVINLMRQFCKELYVIVPAKALSTGTLMCLGADVILMTKQATLGPIDPSVNGPLCPAIAGAPPHARAPVSVEAVRGFIDLAKNELGIASESQLAEVLSKLADAVHPLVLGDVYRTRDQIRMLARRLLSNQLKDSEKLEQIISFLCSDSGSHDYTIDRREARDRLGLNVMKPDDGLYGIIKRIYDDIRADLRLSIPLDPNVVLGHQDHVDYSFQRALIESVTGGSHAFISEGCFKKHALMTSDGIAQTAIEDRRTFEGWRRAV